MRRRRPERRQILPDPVYNNKLVAKFVNYIMDNGKKGIAEKIFYGAMNQIKERTKTDGLKIFEKAIENASPAVEVKSRRVGGATYQVPTEVKRDRGQSLAIRWIINASKQRSEKTMKDKLSAEIVEALNNRGNAVKKREDVHRMAEANKAFSHYKW